MINKRNDKWTGRKFKVTVHLPDVVSESVRQSKIDRLYDILKAANDIVNIPLHIYLKKFEMFCIGINPHGA